MSAETEVQMRFYLTQRLMVRQGRSAGKSFDDLFACDYMGAAEFEWGALPESLKRIRSNRRIEVHQGYVTRRDITVPVFVVGERKRIKRVPDALTAWLVDDRPRGKEMTYFPEAVEGTTQDWQRRTDAWWSLNDDVMWALDINTAERLLLAIRGK